eukprot:910641-Prymnesium_polylepis.1
MGHATHSHLHLTTASSALLRVQLMVRGRGPSLTLQLDHVIAAHRSQSVQSMQSVQSGGGPSLTLQLDHVIAAHRSLHGVPQQRPVDVTRRLHHASRERLRPCQPPQGGGADAATTVTTATAPSPARSRAGEAPQRRGTAVRRRARADVRRRRAAWRRVAGAAP